MKQIFALQHELNARIMQGTDTPYERILSDPALKPLWIEKYRLAYSAELAELVRDVRAFGVGSPNGKVEVVDLLHFAVSLAHLCGISPQEASPMTKAEPPDLSFTGCVMDTFLALDALQGSCKWKWWAKGGGFKPEDARAAVLDLWAGFHRFAAIFELSFPEMKRLYMAKNQVNFERQDAGYNEDTKTEADNQKIVAFAGRRRRR